MLTLDRQYKMLTEHIIKLESKGAPWPLIITLKNAYKAMLFKEAWEKEREGDKIG